MNEVFSFSKGCIIVLLSTIVWILTSIWRELTQIERKLEHPDETRRKNRQQEYGKK